MEKPQVVITLTGNIADFTRLDNVYKAMKRESAKLLKNWELKIDVNFQETETGS